MATCPKCGRRAFGLQLTTCLNCRRQGCDQCQFEFGWTQGYRAVAPKPASSVNVGSLRIPVKGTPGGYAPEPPVLYRACNWQCFDNWATYVTGKSGPPVWNGQNWTLGGLYLRQEAATRATQIHSQQQGRALHQRAEFLMSAGNYEEAAKAYESLGMAKEAREARQRSRQQVVTQVQVNLNNLLDQLKAGGLAANFKCPNCAAPIRVSGSTSAAALQTCQFCGSPIQPTDVADFLLRIMGQR